MGFRIHQVTHAAHVVGGGGGGVLAFRQLFLMSLKFATQYRRCPMDVRHTQRNNASYGITCSTGSTVLKLLGSGQGLSRHEMCVTSFRHISSASE